MTDRYPFRTLRLSANAPGRIWLDFDDGFMGVEFGHVSFKTPLVEGRGNWLKLLNEPTQTLVRVIMQTEDVTSISVSPNGAMIRHSRRGNEMVMLLRLKGALAGAELVGHDDVELFDQTRQFNGAGSPVPYTSHGGVPLQILDDFTLPELSDAELELIRDLATRLGGKRLTVVNAPLRRMSPGMYRMTVFRDHIPTEIVDE